MDTDNFGQRLRAVRQARNLTLRHLAESAEISQALLSQVERGQTSPSLKTLLKLRNALNLPSSFFFEDKGVSPAVGQIETDYICREDERPRLVFEAGAPHKELLHKGHSKVFEMMIVHMPPETEIGPTAFRYPSEKGGLVLAGTPTLRVAGHDSVLYPGDSFQFDGWQSHALLNPSNQIARVLWIIARLPAQIKA